MQDSLGYFPLTKTYDYIDLMQNPSATSYYQLLVNPTCNRNNIGLGFHTSPPLPPTPPPLLPPRPPPHPYHGQVHSSMSLCLSSITVESRAADYQDCGLSSAPVFLSGESPWDSNLEPSSHPYSRDKAMMRYYEKKKTRRYICGFFFFFLLSLLLIYNFS